MSYYAIDDEQRPWTPKETLALLIVLGILVIIAVYFAREPLMQSLRLQSEEQARQARDDRRKAREGVLADDLAILLGHAFDELEALELAHQEFAREFRAAVGLSLDFVSRHPEERGADIDDAILKYDDFPAAWSELMNASLGSRWLDATWHAVYGVEHRIDLGVVVPRDKVTVKQALGEAIARRQIIEDQNENLKLVRDTLATERFRRDLTALERRIP